MCETLPTNNTCLRFGIHPGYMLHLSAFDPFVERIVFMAVMFFKYTKNVTWKHVIDSDTMSALKRLNKTLPGRKDLLKLAAIELDILDTEITFLVPSPATPNLLHLSPPLYESSQVILSTVPSGEDSSTSEPMKLLILDKVIFLSTMAAIVVVSVTYLFITRRFGLKERQINFSNLFRTVWIFLFHLVLNSDLSVLGRSLPTRILLGSWALASFVLIWCYYSSMKLEMVISRSDPVNSIEDLLRKPKLEPYINFGRLEKSITDSDSTYPKLRERMALNGHYGMSSPDEFFPKFFRGTALFICDIQLLDSLIEILDAELVEHRRLLHVGESVYKTVHVHMIFNKKLPANILENLNYIIARVVETQQLEPRIRQAFFLHRKVLDTEKEQLQDSKELSLIFLTPIFTVYLYGIVLSVFVILIECISKFSHLFSYKIHENNGVVSGGSR